MKQPSRIQCKRVQDPAEPSDGYRVLVDRVWPRGIRKEALKADDWRKNLAPSTELRKWFGHDPARWAAFYQKFHAELRQRPEQVDSLLAACDGQVLTLLFAARDREHNNAEALRMFLLDHE